jgi:hypothetical protein
LEEEIGIRGNQKLISTETNGTEWEDDRSITKDFIRFRLIEFDEEEFYDEIILEDLTNDNDILDEDDEVLVHLMTDFLLNPLEPSLGVGNACAGA